MRKVEDERRQRPSKPKSDKGEIKYRDGGLKPAPGYVPRFKYNGFLKNCKWVPYTEEALRKSEAGPTEEEIAYKHRDKAKFCVLMAFAGGRYNGMQYNIGAELESIELHLFAAMAKNKWILPDHVNGMHFVDYSRASRTDHGVSAARMYCSALLREYKPHITLARCCQQLWLANL